MFIPMALRIKGSNKCAIIIGFPLEPREKWLERKKIKFPKTNFLEEWF